ncbi:MAG TPA: hypothetical protein VGL99_28820 [Chloroflexota bacterium]|jgi:sugar phosphate isomerase/epimerase
MATAKLCLKARPTHAQLADRLQPVDGAVVDGLELYLAAEDLASTAAIDGVVERIEAARLPSGFAVLIEGPVDSLDGGDFDVTRDSEADAVVVRRLAELARRIGAQAVNIHLIAPAPDPGRLTLACRTTLLERCVPFFQRFVELTSAAGAVPTIENMPPVLRMRRGDFAFTPIGMCAADLIWMSERVRGLRVLVDTSHAGLYVHARAGATDTHAWVEPLRSYVQQLPEDGSTVLDYVQGFGPYLENAQVSNASGLLGEGLPYAEGDVALDPVIAWLGAHTRHIVTETIEPNNDDARYMRDALRRMRSVLG